MTISIVSGSRVQLIRAELRTIPQLRRDGVGVVDDQLAHSAIRESGIFGSGR